MTNTRATLAILVLLGGCTQDATCDSPNVDCLGLCVNLETDVLNCGGCGIACPTGQVCEMGLCVVSCQEGHELCSGICRDVSSDEYNCGACGNICPSGHVCVDGACSVVCPEGYSDCSGTCRNLGNDPANCGACGTVCDAGWVCADGTCSFTCPSPYTDCSGSCVDLSIDHLNCGACGSACDPGEICSSGSCVPSCLEGLTLCTGECRDLMRDPANCGSCASACLTGEVCYDGACTASCPGGFTDCSGSCRDTDSDRLHCGACDAECAPGEVCEAGACEATCAAPLVVCPEDTDGDTIADAEICSDLNNDPSNCGACGTTCTSSQGCVAGSCVEISCILVEDFEAGVWPVTPWVAHASGGTIDTTAAHDGTYGLINPGWHYRTDVTTGDGMRYTAWIRTDSSTSGRFYLGFDSSSGGCKSFVIAPNTDEIMFQNNSSWSYASYARVAQTYLASHWYLAEVTVSGSVATGRLYDSDGSTLVNSTVYDYGTIGSGGVAMRGFSGVGVDTITLCP